MEEPCIHGINHYAVPVLVLQQMEATAICVNIIEKLMKLVVVYLLSLDTLSECISGRKQVCLANDLNAKHKDGIPEIILQTSVPQSLTLEFLHPTWTRCSFYHFQLSCSFIRCPWHTVYERLCSSSKGAIHKLRHTNFMIFLSLPPLSQVVTFLRSRRHLVWSRTFCNFTPEWMNEWMN